MSSKDETKKLIANHNRRLQILKEQRALFGPLHIPPHILIEIEDTEAIIKELETKLGIEEENSVGEETPVVQGVRKESSDRIENSPQAKIKHLRTEILRTLYDKQARDLLNAIGCEDLTDEMNMSWDKIRLEVTYLEEKRCIFVKSRKIGNRIFCTIYLTAEGVDLVERGISDRHIR